MSLTLMNLYHDTMAHVYTCKITKYVSIESSDECFLIELYKGGTAYQDTIVC